MKMRFLDALAIAFDTQDTEIPEVHGWDVGDVLSSCVTHTSIALDKLERYLPTP